MKKFVVGRILPGAGNLTPGELQSMAQTSCETISHLGKRNYWIQSFITSDKIYCIHVAESEEVIREHASIGNFPINTVEEVTAVIDPLTSKVQG